MKRALLPLMIAGLSCVGCAEDGDTPPGRADAGSVGRADSAAEPVEPAELCDGSERIRFGYDVVGITTGFSSDPFFDQYGADFFFLRGDCRYVRGGGYGEHEFREGTLDAAQAEQLAREVDFATLRQRFVREQDDPCWDQPTERVHGPSSTFSCRCCKVWKPTHDVVEGLLTDSTVVQSAVTAAAATRSNTEPDLARPRWPLATSIREILVPEMRYAPSPEDGRRFDDPDDRAALRALRDSARKDGSLPASIEVQDGDGPVYAVYVRDELPADMESMVQELLAERGQ